MTTQEKTPTGGNQTGASQDIDSGHQCSRSRRSTATAAQEERILEALRAGPKTTDDLRAIGIFQVSARVFGLRARGYDVRTELFNGIGADKCWHLKMARYTLVEGPQAALPFVSRRSQPQEAGRGAQ